MEAKLDAVVGDWDDDVNPETGLTPTHELAIRAELAAERRAEKQEAKKRQAEAPPAKQRSA